MKTVKSFKKKRVLVKLKRSMIALTWMVIEKFLTFLLKKVFLSILTYLNVIDIS